MRSSPTVQGRLLIWIQCVKRVRNRKQTPAFVPAFSFAPGTLAPAFYCAMSA